YRGPDDAVPADSVLRDEQMVQDRRSKDDRGPGKDRDEGARETEEHQGHGQRPPEIRLERIEGGESPPEKLHEEVDCGMAAELPGDASKRRTGNRSNRNSERRFW